MTYALATVAVGDEPTPVIRVGEHVYRLADLCPGLIERPRSGLLELFERWDDSEPRLSAAAKSVEDGTATASPLERPLEPDDFLAPLLYPRKVVCFGANYYEHMHGDAGMKDYDKAAVVPTMFVKPATTTVVGAGKSVRYPGQTEAFDWEIELCAIIGRTGRKIARADARAHIAAFTIGIDLSARDWQLHQKHPFKFDVYGGKAFDDSCPIGPWVIPARFVDDGNLRLRLSLNGVVKQDASTSDMIWTLDEQIEAMSLHVTLEAGDVIMTGTPAGVGMKSGTYMKVGDRLTAEIDQLGILEVEIMPDQSDRLR